MGPETSSGDEGEKGSKAVTSRERMRTNREKQLSYIDLICHTGTSLFEIVGSFEMSPAAAGGSCHMRSSVPRPSVKVIFARESRNLSPTGAPQNGVATTGKSY